MGKCTLCGEEAASSGHRCRDLYWGKELPRHEVDNLNCSSAGESLDIEMGFRMLSDDYNR